MDACYEARRQQGTVEPLLRTLPTNSKVFLRGSQNMREKQILRSAIEIQKENKR